MRILSFGEPVFKLVSNHITPLAHLPEWEPPGFHLVVQKAAAEAAGGARLSNGQGELQVACICCVGLVMDQY